jgi:hypothetical protein
MDVHRLTAGGATRQALAGLVLLATFLGCLWIGTYQEFHAVGFGLMAVRYTLGWAVPVAVVIGIGGALLALLMYRQGQRRKVSDRRSAQGSFPNTGGVSFSSMSRTF